MPDFYQINTPLVGSQVLNGAAAPTSGVGADGDFYIQTSGTGSPKIWGPKLSGAWPATGTSMVQSAATDAIYDAVGDLVVGTGADTAARFAKGSARQSLVVGSSTLEWDANHFSGTNFLSSVEAAAIAETVPPTSATFVSQTTGISVSGVPHLHGIYLPKNTTVTYITFVTGTTAAGTPTNQWFALCDSTRKVLRVTTNDTTTAWAANTGKRLALTSTYTTTYSGLYYVACVVTASTMPSYRSIGSGVTVNLSTGMHSFTATPAGLTTPASVTEGTTTFTVATRVAAVQGIVS